MKIMVLKHEVVRLSTNGGKTDYNCVAVDWLSPRCSPRPTLWTHTLTPLSLYIYIQLRIYIYTVPYYMARCLAETTLDDIRLDPQRKPVLGGSSHLDPLSK